MSEIGTAILPWVQTPWIAGGILLSLPLVAGALLWWSRRNRSDQASLVTAYSTWALGGFLGLHRFYLRNRWGMLYWPLVAVAIWAWSMDGATRVGMVEAQQKLEQVDGTIDRNVARTASSTAGIEAVRAAMAATVDETKLSALALELERETQRIAEARDVIESTKAAVPVLQTELADLAAAARFWRNTLLTVLLAIAAFLAIDGLLLMQMKREADARAIAAA